MKHLAVAFTGVSNSGKTTFIEKISYILSVKSKVCIIKHDPKDKAELDKEGKDSYKFVKSGANVALLSPKRTTLFLNESRTLFEVAKLFGEFDYLLVEGLKHLELPRICIFRDEIVSDYIDYSDAFAIDSKKIDRSKLPDDKAILDLNSPQSAIEWIDKYGKCLK